MGSNLLAKEIMTRLASGRATTVAKPDEICARDPILAGVRGSNHPPEHWHDLEYVICRAQSARNGKYSPTAARKPTWAMWWKASWPRPLPRRCCHCRKTSKHGRPEKPCFLSSSAPARTAPRVPNKQCMTALENQAQASNSGFLQQ